MRQGWPQIRDRSETEAHTTTVSARLRSAGFLHITLGLREEWGEGFRYRIGLPRPPPRPRVLLDCDAMRTTLPLPRTRESFPVFERGERAVTELLLSLSLWHTWRFDDLDTRVLCAAALRNAICDGMRTTRTQERTFRNRRTPNSHLVALAKNTKKTGFGDFPPPLPPDEG